MGWNELQAPHRAAVPDPVLVGTAPPEPMAVSEAGGPPVTGRAGLVVLEAEPSMPVRERWAWAVLAPIARWQAVVAAPAGGAGH